MLVRGSCEWAGDMWFVVTCCCCDVLFVVTCCCCCDTWFVVTCCCCDMLFVCLIVNVALTVFIFPFVFSAKQTNTHNHGSRTSNNIYKVLLLKYISENTRENPWT